MFNDRVKETSTTTGTGSLTLAGASTNYVSFNTAFGTNRRFVYIIVHQTASEWESGIGYLSASTTLVREQVRNNSSGTTSAINFSSGTKDVFIGPTRFSHFLCPTGYQNASSRGVASRHISQGNPSSSQATGANKLRLTPFYLEIGLVATGMRIEIVTAAASSRARMGLYEVKPNGLPGNLLFETADVDTSTTGFKTGSATAKYFPPGCYYSACAGDNATVTFRRHAAGGFGPSFLGQNVSTSEADSCMIYSLSSGWTALPSADPSATDSGDSTGCLYITLVGDVV